MRRGRFQSLLRIAGGTSLMATLFVRWVRVGNGSVASGRLLARTLADNGYWLAAAAVISVACVGAVLLSTAGTSTPIANLARVTGSLFALSVLAALGARGLVPPARWGIAPPLVLAGVAAVLIADAATITKRGIRVE